MNNKITIGITGADGHIGSALTKYLSTKGYRVIALVRKSRVKESVEVRRFDLTEEFPDELFRDIDVLIHCAYVSSTQHPDAEHTNIHGSKLLFKACRSQGVKKIIFFSTLTSHSRAMSGYARSKYEIEKLLEPNIDFVARCSMVIGTGGLFQRLLFYATSHTIIPTVGPGNQIMQLVTIEDLVSSIERIIVDDICGTGVLANHETLTYRQFFSSIADAYGKKLYFVPFPSQILLSVLKLCKWLHIKTGASEENIQGMHMLRRQEPLLLLDHYTTFSEKLIALRDSSPPSG